MNRSKITHSFNRLPDGALNIKALGILQALENNIYFPDAPSLQQLDDAISHYRDTLKLAENGGRPAIAEKNKAKQLVVEKLTQLAAYVTLAADGDKTKLLTSGFDIAKTGTTRLAVQAPEELIVVNGINPGEIIVKVKADRGARSYNHEYTADPLTENSNWITEPDSRSRHLFTGLQQVKKYWFRSIAVGSGGRKASSQPVSCVVL